MSKMNMDIPKESSIMEKTSRRRYPELDVFKTIAMITMVFIHSLEQFSVFVNNDADQTVKSAYTLFSYFYAIDGPSVLMMCLGANLAFGRTKTPKELAKRGVCFIALDIGLNVARYGVPAIALALMGNSRFLSYFAQGLLNSDIYAFVGVAFLAFALLQKLKLSAFDIILVAIGMLTINTVLVQNSWLSVNNDIVKGVLRRFFWMDELSYFSLFPWFIFPAVGFQFGEIYKKIETEQQKYFVGKVFKFCVIGFLAVCAALTVYDIPVEILNVSQNKFKTDVLNVIMMILVGGITFSLTYKIAHICPNSRFVSLCTDISRSIVPFYVIHWILISWFSYLFQILGAYNAFNSLMQINAFALAICAASLMLSLRVKKKR